MQVLLLCSAILLHVCNAVELINVRAESETTEECHTLDTTAGWCSISTTDDGDTKCFVTSYRHCDGVRYVGTGTECRNDKLAARKKCDDGVWRNVNPQIALRQQTRTKRYAGWMLWKDSPPKIICPQDITVTASAGKVTASVDFHISASDDWGTPVITLENGSPSGSMFSEGRTFVQYGAVDSAQKHASCHFYVIVSVTYCPSLSHFALGTRSCSGARSNVYGSKCTHTCNTGHVLSGRYSITCYSTGAWCSPFPSCQPVSCGSPGYVTRGTYYCSQGYTYPNRCYLQCNPGYVQSGAASVTCSSSGTWTSGGYCRDAEVPVFPYGCPAYQSVFSGPLRAPVTVTWPQPVARDSSGTVTVRSTMNSGSSVGPGSYTVVVTATDPSGNAATCSFVLIIKVRQCPQIRAPSNGSVICTADQVEGSVCSFSCDLGFRVQGQTTLKCVSTELWDASFPACDAVICPLPPSVAFGTFSCPTGQQSPAMCSLTCAAGFKVTGDQNIQCLQNGSWSSPGACEDIESPRFVSGCPASIETFAARLGQSTYVNWTTPVVSDNSGGAIRLTNSVSPGSVFPVGNQTVTYTATDVTGNVNTCQINVQVKEYSCGPPSFQSPVPSFQSPVPSFQSPVPSYQSPVPSFQSPVPSFQSPETSYQSPVPSYQSPVPSFQSSVPSYQSPVPSYQSPVPSYQSPETSYQSPVPSYQSPETSYQSPRPSPMLTTCPDGHVHGAVCTVSCTPGYRLHGRMAVSCERDDRTHPPAMAWSWNDTEAFKPQCKEDRCPALRSPKNGAQSCYHGDNGWDCFLHCKSSWDVPDSTDGHFVCSNGHNVWVPDVVPDCVVRTHPQRVRILSTLLYFTGSCEALRDDIRRNFISVIKQTIYNVSCSAIPSCVAENINVTCGEVLNHKKRPLNADDLITNLQERVRREANVKTLHFVSVTFHVSFPYRENGSSPEETFQTYRQQADEVNKQLKWHASDGAFSRDDLDLYADHWSVGRFRVQAVCPAGTEQRAVRQDQARFSCLPVED